MGGGITVGGRRQAARTLMRALAAGRLAEHEIVQSLDFAVKMRDDPLASPRDRLRAMELIDAVAARGVNVAMAVAKIEASDNKAPNQTNVQVNVGVKFIKGVDESSI